MTLAAIAGSVRANQSIATCVPPQSTLTCSRFLTGTAAGATSCSGTFLIYLFLRIAGVSYGRFMASVVS